MFKESIKNNNIKKSILGIIIFICISLVLSIIIGFYVLKNNASQKELLNNPNIYNNIFINNINVGNMSIEEAKNTVSSNILNEKVILSFKDKEYTFNKPDLGLNYSLDEAIEIAYNIGRVGSKKERLKEIKLLSESSKNITIETNINEDMLKTSLEKISTEINIAPKNATFKKTSSGFEIIEGSNGIEVDFEQTYKDILDAINTSGNNYISIIANETKPKYNPQDLNKVQHKLGGFSTAYTSPKGSENRITNMQIASSKINGTILYPGEIFSTNEKFGPTTKANGYKPAPTIINGNLEDEYGGGVCQVSSTLYNAVLYSELAVVERQNHSLKVGYLDYGYDATLAGTYIDFKFKNSTSAPIYIESYLANNKVVCNIYGYEERPSNRSIKFENALIEVMEAGPSVKKETEELFQGEEKVEVKPLKGYKYKLYKLIYVDGVLKEKVFVNNSYYKPRAEQILVGTKPVVQNVVNPNDTTISTENLTTETSSTSQTEIQTETSSIKIEETTQETTLNISTETTTESIIKEDIILD